MNQRLRAVYRNGAFVPRQACDLPEESEVDLLVQGPLALPPEVTDPAEQARLLRRVTERMRQNPIPADTPRLTREELHAHR